MKLNFWVILLCISGVFAASPKAIAVSDLENPGTNLDEARIVSDRLRQELLSSGKFRVMERSLMDQILKEQSFQQSGACDGTECQVQMGRLLGVDLLVVGSLGKLGSTYTLSARSLNVETGEVLHSASVDYSGQIDGLLTGPIRDLAMRLSQDSASSQINTQAPKLGQDKSSRMAIWATRIALGTAMVVLGYMAYSKDQEVEDENDKAASYKLEALAKPHLKKADDAATSRNIYGGVASVCALGLGVSFFF